MCLRVKQSHWGSKNSCSVPRILPLIELPSTLLSPVTIAHQPAAQRHQQNWPIIKFHSLRSLHDGFAIAAEIAWAALKSENKGVIRLVMMPSLLPRSFYVRCCAGN